MVANNQLKREREIRGWSQERLAQELGIDVTTVSRWERGVSLPYPYFREKLCLLFNKKEEELGLLVVSSEDNRENQKNTSQTEKKRIRVDDPATPFMWNNSERLVGRDTLLANLKTQLCSQKTPLSMAFYGLPGVGKTSLTLKLATDPQIQARFPDGLLWAGLGSQPYIQAIFSRWQTLLGVKNEIKESNLKQWCMNLRNAIGGRSMLIVIDDAWRLEDALPLLVGGTGCSYLLTTRFPLLARSFALTHAVEIPELLVDDGMALLAYFVPELVQRERECIEDLVRAVGALPLALSLIGRYLHVQSSTNQLRRLSTALKSLQSPLYRINLSLPSALIDLSPSLFGGISFSLQTVISTSDQYLKEQERAALRALSIFPAKPNDFSEEAALAISEAPVEVLDGLNDAGLLEYTGPGRYTLHQTIADYAREHLQTQAPYERFINYMVQFVEDHRLDMADLEREHSNILAFLDLAFEQKKYAELIRGFFAVGSQFLRVRGMDKVAELHLQRAQEAAQALGNSRMFVLLLLQQSIHAKHHGWYKQAEEDARRSLHIAQANKLSDLESLSYSVIGAILQDRGEIEQAENSLRKALEIALLVQQPSIIMIAQIPLAFLLELEGQYEQALVYANEGLSWSEQANNRETLSSALILLGKLTRHKGDLALAQQYIQRGLLIAKEMKHQDLICQALELLGETNLLLDNRERALEYIGEGLQLAEQIEHPYHISSFFILQSKYFLQQRNIKKAWIAIREAESALPAEHPALRAEIAYVYASVARLKGNVKEALKRGEESRNLFLQLGYCRAHEVSDFLDHLS